MKKNLFFLLVLLTACGNSQPKQSEYQYLDALAIESGADKASTYHNYTEVYAHHFASLKDQPIKFLEIGIYKGDSVKLWEKYFPKAELHFMDITFENVIYTSNRSNYHLADQSNADQLNQFIQKVGGGFDVIIDDGGHTMNQQIVSFMTLFPHVKSGGMYIIEDLHTSYWAGYTGPNPQVTTVSVLKEMVDHVNFVGAYTTRASHQNLPPEVADKLGYFQKHVKSICFYDSLAIITKR